MSYSISKSVTKNTALMLTGQLMTGVSGFVLLMFLPRYLGSAGYGELYLAISIQTIFQYLIDFGGAYHVTKEIARDKERASEIVTHSAILRIGIWALSMVLIFALCGVARYSASTILLVVVLGVSNLWVSITSLLRFSFQAFEDMKYPTIGAVIERSFLVIAVVPAMLLGATELAVVILMAVSTVLSFAYSAKYAKRMFRFSFVVRRASLKPMFHDAIPYFLWSLFGVIYYRIDAVLLSFMVPVVVIGWYGAAYRFFDILMFVPSIVAQALYPILSRLSKSEVNSMLVTSQKSLEYLLMVSIPIAVGLLFFSGQIIDLLFGAAQYAPSVIVLQIFAVGIIIVYVDFIIGNTVLALDKEKAWAFVGFGAIFVNVGINYLLISLFQSRFGNGGIGAAIATDLTELFVMLCGIALLPKGIFSRRVFTVAVKCVAAGVIMSSVIIGFDFLDLSVFLSAPAAILVYIMALTLLATIEAGEIDSVLRTFVPKSVRNFIFVRKGINA